MGLGEVLSWLSKPLNRLSNNKIKLGMGKFSAQPGERDTRGSPTCALHRENVNSLCRRLLTPAQPSFLRKNIEHHLIPPLNRLSRLAQPVEQTAQPSLTGLSGGL